MINNGQHVYHGFWIDWSYGYIEGATLTLSARNGNLLTAFFAFFVTITGARLWKILSFIIHQVRAGRRSRDGLYYQQQAIFRNTSSPADAAWAFTQMIIYWWSNATQPLLRSLPWAVFAILCMLAFASAGVFSAEMTRAAGNTTLVISPDCGIWGYRNDFEDIDHDEWMQTLEAMTRSASYAKACYTTASAQHQQRCEGYVVPRIPYICDGNASCPFAKGTCLGSDAAAYKMDTGPVDSHTMLGINTPVKERLTYRRVTTCAPLTTEGFVDNITDTMTKISENTTDITTLEQVESNGVTSVQCNYGHVINATEGNVTSVFNVSPLKNEVGYQLRAFLAALNYRDTWQPISELDRTDADITLLLLAQNQILYEAQSDDPFFAAHQQNGTSFYYLPDADVNVMGCTDQFELCNLSNNLCTPLTGILQAQGSIQELGLSPLQTQIANRIVVAAAEAIIGENPYHRGATALRAHDTVFRWSFTNIQIRLPPNQWTIEMKSLFESGLAHMQQQIVQYATGPPSITGKYIDKPYDPIRKGMCYSQKFRSIERSASFSVLGMSIILAVGIIIIPISYFLDIFVGSAWYRPLKHGRRRHRQWILSSTLQLQRIAFERVGMGTWSGKMDPIPVTQPGEQLADLDGVYWSRRLLASSANLMSTVHEEGEEEGEEEVGET